MKLKLLMAYLSMNRTSILMGLLFALLLIIVCFLNHIPFTALLYATAMFLGMVLLFALVHFHRFVKKHLLLCSLQHDLLNVDQLPPPQNLLEEDCHAIIGGLIAAKDKILCEASNEKIELTDYYILWAHQIKTPISAMQLLLQRNQGLRDQELASELFKIEQYVQMVLQFLRLESISSDFVFQEYELDSIVRQCIRKYSKLFILNKIEVRYEPMEYRVLTDEKWLLFALEQLISNALKYTKKGWIQISMDPAEKHTLVIEDTGIGIAPEDIFRIFEKSFTGYNGRADKKSTGIGLYLAKRILSKLSHTITIESAVGQGTKVKIQFQEED